MINSLFLFSIVLSLIVAIVAGLSVHRSKREREPVASWPHTDPTQGRLSVMRVEARTMQSATMQSRSVRGDQVMCTTRRSLRTRN